MKNILLLFAMSIILSSVTYASFPVTQPADEVLITTTTEPMVSGASLNWQAIVSVSCLLIGFSVSWLFLIPGLVFGIMGIIGDKNMKWLGWIGMIANAFWLLLVLAILGSV
tara:strand:+ start:23108 stop:23440 length:333 start_codon:yes stop_codon:yes gene_type:complete